MLLDNVAEAIWREHGKHEPQAGTWNSAEPAVRERFMAYASAALTAIANPTPTMLSKGNQALQTWEHSEHYRSPVDGIYHAMIAAELPAAASSKKAPRDSFDEL
jgi:hypothetical protein